MIDNEEFILSEEDISNLETLLAQKGWKIYLKLLDTEFNAKYKHLRNTRKTDLGYARINGFLDGVERAGKVIEETVNAYRSQKQDENNDNKNYSRRSRNPLFKVVGSGGKEI